MEYDHNEKVEKMELDYNEMVHKMGVDYNEMVQKMEHEMGELRKEHDDMAEKMERQVGELRKDLQHARMVIDELEQKVTQQVDILNHTVEDFSKTSKLLEQEQVKSTELAAVQQIFFCKYFSDFASMC